jgi:DNA invertase Pin-like site-specific DNA recombinase
MNEAKFEIDAETAGIVVETLKKTIAILTKERSEIEQKITDANAKLKDLKTKLGITDPTCKGARLRKGEADRLITSYFTAAPGKGFSISEIAAATGLKQSSVRNVLIRGKAKYEEGTDNLWRLRKQT